MSKMRNRIGGIMKIRDLNTVVDFPYEVRINSILDAYTVLEDRLMVKNLPRTYKEFLNNVKDYCDIHDELDLISINQKNPVIRLKNLDIRDLVIKEITPDWIVYVGWEKNIKREEMWK